MEGHRILSSVLIGIFEVNVREYPSFGVICDTGLHKGVCPEDDLLLVVFRVVLYGYHCFWTNEVCSSTLQRESI